MSSLDLKELLEIPDVSTYLDKVDVEVKKALASTNPYIHKPLTRIIKAPGKRLRSALVIGIVNSQNMKIDSNIIDACAAIELIHIGSLVHDDLIDHAMNRRSVPTINSLEGADSSIIIGDYVLAKACLKAGKVSPMVSARVAATITELCDGQIQELADQYNLKRKQSDYFKSISGKTSSLISSACAIAGMCTGLDDVEIGALSTFGYEFGLSFQILDDLLDFLSTAELLGKPVGNDIKEGVYNLPVLMSLADPKASDLRKMLKQKTTDSLQEVINIMIEDGSIRRSLLLVVKHNQIAAKALSALGNNKKLKPLLNLPKYYLEWSADNLIDNKYKPLVAEIIKNN